MSNLMGGKEFQKQAKESDRPLPPLGVLTPQVLQEQANSYHVCRRPGADPCRPRAGLFSLSPRESCLFDSVGRVFLVPSSHLTAVSLPPAVPRGSLAPRLTTSDVDSPLIMSGCGSLHPLPSVARGNLIDDNWTRHTDL